MYIAVGILVILIYILICSYIGYNGLVWLQSTFLAKYKKVYIAIIFLLSVSFFAGRFIYLNFIDYVGGYWVAVVGYSLILLPLANLFYFLVKKKGLFWIGVVVLSIFIIIFTLGSYNAWNPVVRTYDIEIKKKSELKELKLFIASDLHGGTVVGTKHLKKLVNLVESEKPDIILIPGDIINDHIEPFAKGNMGEILKQLDAPLGVYAVLGNHDYYGNDTKELLLEMGKNGVTVLTDQAKNINNHFYLVGRKDRTDTSRSSVEQLVQDLDHSKPIIMMDHQPYELDVAEGLGIDILLAGHTHRGQLAPAHLVTGRIYENDWGYLQKGNMHSFVSSGFGLWGPPLRLGSRSEVMVLNVKFTN